MLPESFPGNKLEPIHDQHVVTASGSIVPKFVPMPSEAMMGKKVHIATLNPNASSMMNQHMSQMSPSPGAELPSYGSLQNFNFDEDEMPEHFISSSKPETNDLHYHDKNGNFLKKSKLYPANNFKQYDSPLILGKNLENIPSIMLNSAKRKTNLPMSSENTLSTYDYWLDGVDNPDNPDTMQIVEEGFWHSPEADLGISHTSAAEQGKYKKLVAAAKDAGKVLLDEVMKTVKGTPAVYQEPFAPLNWKPSPEALNIWKTVPPTESQSPEMEKMLDDFIASKQTHDVPETHIETVEIANPEIDGKQHFVKDAPIFEEQIRDKSRTNTFRHLASYGANPMSFDDLGNPDIRELTEHQGLVELHDFLMDCTTNPKMAANDDYETYMIQAKSMLENLTFIGKKEYDEAVQGLGKLWKDYLESDPDNQICVPLAITRSEGLRKSDTYLFENILATFSDGELEQYSGRIVQEVSDITKEPENVRIILLDDWTISGAQMSSSYRSISSSRAYSKYAVCVRVNLIAASENRLEKGLGVGNGNWGNNETARLPVESYFRAHTAEGSVYGTHTTGTHSSVDYDFQTNIANMRSILTTLDSLPDGTPTEKVKMPPLTNIVRTYRNSKPAVVIEKDGQIRRNKK